MKKTVILDTDFILGIVKNNIDADTEIKSIVPYKCELCVFDSTFDELKGKPLEEAAIEYIKNYKIIRTNQKISVDDAILELIGKKKDIIVATQDKKLKEKLKKRKIPIITIRQQKYLIFI